MGAAYKSRDMRLRRLTFREEGEHREALHISRPNNNNNSNKNTVKLFKPMCRVSEFHINFIKFFNTEFFLNNLIFY